MFINLPLTAKSTVMFLLPMRLLDKGDQPTHIVLERLQLLVLIFVTFANCIHMY